MRIGVVGLVCGCCCWWCSWLVMVCCLWCWWRVVGYRFVRYSDGLLWKICIVGWCWLLMLVMFMIFICLINRCWVVVW